MDDDKFSNNRRCILKEIPQFPFFFYNTIPKYLRILTPLHDLITFLEGDRTPACLAYPAIQ